MLSKFISVSETRYQNTKIAFKNQQASIQGLETQIGQLSKLISERPQGSLPSNIEPNPREQLNAINEMNLKEVQEPFSSRSRGPIHEDRMLQIEELDEWWTYKSRTHDKPKLRQNELNTFPNQLKVGDKVLLDAADPHIVTTKLNEEILLRYLAFSHSGKDFLNTGYDKLLQLCNMAVGELAKTTWACNTHVPGNRGQTC
ncbi:hypothetical protein GOBAR_AA17916 [Gossypium barbadense]|uniref:Uncharacterized protein n=1 Tax=Gossypium barbadense TaxID=3634 RepID=A0A2P5XHB8_GOSBA|nr:hypothetical protein GOBAR_AA17916 [Gossypium barbadense]